MERYSHKERIMATLDGIVTDRPPVTAYRHFPQIEGNMEKLAETMIGWQEKYDWDFIKIHPSAVYMQEVWGDRFDFDHYQQEVFPTKLKNVNGKVDLGIFTEKRIDNPYLQEQISVVQQITDHFQGEIPVFQTLFTPLQVISGVFDCQFVRRHFSAKREENEIFTIMKDRAKELQDALENITDTYISYWKALRERGADGVFYAGVSWARENFMTLDEWETYIKKYDLKFLKEVQKDGGKVLYHTCGIQSNPQRFADFPIDILHWDQGAEGNPSLKEGSKFLDKIIPMGGVDEMTFGNHAEKTIAEETRACVAANRNLPYILAPYCSISVHSTDAEIRAFRDNADCLSTIR